MKELGIKLETSFEVQRQRFVRVSSYCQSLRYPALVYKVYKVGSSGQLLF